MRRGSGWDGLAWAFCLLALAVFAVLVTTGINGSSIGMLYAQQENVSAPPAIDDPDLLLGKPRAIRSDEWSIGTPSAVSQTVQAFPDEPWIGLTRTDATMFPYGLPVLGVTTVVKPQTWGYLLLGPERGLAWSWWFPFLLATCAVFALAHLITGRFLISATAAVVASFTPFVAWWTSPSPNLFTGFAALAAFAALRGFRGRSLVTGALWGALAGWAVAASTLMLYPPWTVSTGLVAAAVVIGAVIDARPGLWRVITVAASAGAVAALVAVPWVLRVTPVIKVINETIYPGQRRSGSGDGVWQLLASGPSNLVTATRGLGPSILNQSEVASTWLPVVLLVILAAIGLFGGRRSAAPNAPTGKASVIALLVVLLLLLAWMFVPSVPSVVGKVTLLSRVPGTRLPLALGMGGVLLAVVLSTIDMSRTPRWLVRVAVAIGLAAAVVSTVAAARFLYPGMSRTGLLATAAGAAIIAAAFAAMVTGVGTQVLLPLAIVYAVVSFGVVNPVYRGLGPLDHDPVALYSREVAGAQPGATAVTLGGRELQALVRGGGMQVQSWTTQYPDRAFWEKVLPGQEEVWNNYRNYAWYYDPAADPVRAQVTAPDAAELYVDLCDPVIRGLGFVRVFSAAPVAAGCLEQDRVVQRGDQRIYIYRPGDQ